MGRCLSWRFAVRPGSDAEQRGGSSKASAALFSALLFGLGLVPLIKGSLIAIAGASSVGAFLIFLSAGLPLLAAASLVLPAAGVAAFWIFAGQSLADIPAYFLNMQQIISGYTEAHALDRDFREVITFIAASAAIFWVVLTMGAKTGFKVPLAIVFAAFLFSAFKNGFVRHADGHAYYAAAALLLAAVAINLTPFNLGRSASVLWIAVMAWFVIDGAYIRSVPDLLYFNLLKSYSEGVDGFRQRYIENVDLNQAFSKRVASIAAQAQFPKLEGPTDIYNYGQSYLLASGAHWRPRPVLQSYSADTAYLASLDRDHLAGPNAADNILFKLETIDDRFPTMDDGASWPVLLSKYTLAAVEPNDYLLLKRIKDAAAPEMSEALSGSFSLGEDVELPTVKALLYAEITVEPTFFGKAASLLYKPEILRIVVTLANGQTRNFRVDSAMMSAGFLLSPLIENTGEFGDLFGNYNILRENEVRSIRIDGNPLYWRPSYRLHIRAADPVANSVTKVDLNQANKLIDQSPPGLIVSQADNCEGSIDHLNGQPVKPVVNITNLVSVDGWMTISGKDGTMPDDVYVTVTAKGGRTNYVKARKAERTDLAKYFGHPEMIEAGFLTAFDTSELKGNLVLGLARKTGARLELCKNFHFSLHHEGDPPPAETPEPTPAVISDAVDEAAASLREKSNDVCEGSIETMNEARPDPLANLVSGSMQVRGWTTISGKDSILPDAVLLRIEGQKGDIRFVTTRALPRADLKVFFNQPNLPDAGFTANVDASKLSGPYTIGIFRLYHGVLQVCQRLKFPVVVRP